MITNVFFDLDNTLWDFRKNSQCALEKLFEEKKIEEIFDISFEEFYPKYYQNNEELWAKFRDGDISDEFLRNERFRLSFHQIGIDEPSISQFFEDHYLKEITHFNHLVPNALELIQYLEPHYRLHILTNGFLEVTQRKISESPLHGHFHTITSADEVGKRKPHPEVYEFALKKAKAQASKSAYIGDDWLADGIGARDVGMLSIYYDALGEGQQAEGITTVKNLSEVKELL